MKFSCPKCNARYAVADDKLPVDKLIRLTCKQCKQSFRIRRRTKGAPTESGAFVALISGATPTQPDPGVAEPAVAAPPPKPKAPSPPKPLWHVIIGGQQRGPMDIAEIQALIEAGSVDGRTFAWRAGLADWQRLAGLSEFKLKQAPPPVPMHEAPTAAMSPARLAAELEKMRVAPEPSFTDVATVVTLSPFASTMQGDGLDAFAPAPDSAPTATRVVEPTPDSAGYLQAPPGEHTRVFMATAGIFKRRRMQRLAAIAATCSVVTLVGFVTADVMGLIEIPAMGFVYDMAGMADPNVARAIERTEAKLAASDISPEERNALRTKLLGLSDNKKQPVRVTAPTKKVEKQEVTVGVADSQTLKTSERDVATLIFNDARKSAATPELRAPSELQAPNLPEGLTQEAIMQVISSNQRSMSLCITEAMKAGEELRGRMEVSITITGTGSVAEVQILTAKFRNSTMGDCTAKRMRGWRFPRFNGTPVDVSFPYVLSAGI